METQTAIRLTAAWLMDGGSDIRNDFLPNAMRRAAELRKPDAGYTYDTEVVYDRTPSLTSIALSLKFFSLYALADKGDMTPKVRQLAGYIMALQYLDPDTARYGGFREASNSGTTGSFSTGLALEGLLTAYKVTGDANYLASAVLAGDYLKMMAAPNARYAELYGETPIPAEPENAAFAGFCDTVSATDIIAITSTTWDLVAVNPLYALAEVTGDTTYADTADAALEWMKTGVLEGRDYFALKNTSPSAHVSVDWPNSSSHDYADGAWHRLGDVANTGTVGTDQVEYGLMALYDAGYDLEELQTAYEFYRGLAHADAGSTPFGDAYDGAICFPGYFRLDSPVYGGGDRAFGGYYDVQGAGTLLRWKFDQYPTDYNASLPMVQEASQHGALVDQNNATIYTAETGYVFATKGSIPIAKAGIALLEIEML